MKILILILSICFNLFAIPLPKHKCSEEATELVKKWGSEEFWSRRGKNLFITPSNKFGEWIYYKLEKDNSLTLTKTGSKKNIKVNFSPSCKRDLKVVTNKSQKDKLADTQLYQLIKKGKGLIYIWSPNMPLSYRQINYLEEEAKKHKMSLIVLVDPKHKVSTKKIPAKYLKSLDALEFKHRNAYIHFPTLFAFENGKLKNKVKYGYENKKGFESDIKNFFNL